MHIALKEHSSQNLEISKLHHVYLRSIPLHRECSALPVIYCVTTCFQSVLLHVFIGGYFHNTYFSRPETVSDVS